MARRFKGNVRQLPPGLSPMEWARAVWDVMDEAGINEKTARDIIQKRQEREYPDGA